MTRILPEPGSQAPHIVHSSVECSWSGGGALGARQQVVCRLHRRVGAWDDGWPCHPAPSHPPNQAGPDGIDRVTVDDHIDASEGRRGGLWWWGQSKQWVSCSGPLSQVARPAHCKHDGGRGQAPLLHLPLSSCWRWSSSLFDCSLARHITVRSWWRTFGRACVDRLSIATAGHEKRRAMVGPDRAHQPTRTTPWTQHDGSSAMAGGTERVVGGGRGGM